MAVNKMNGKNPGETGLARGTVLHSLHCCVLALGWRCQLARRINAAVVTAIVLLILEPFPSHAQYGGGVDYSVDWPAIHLKGVFTVEVPPQFGNYFSTYASGTYGGLNGAFQAQWTKVQVNTQPDWAQITFLWDQGFTSYAVNPAYVGRTSPWTSGVEAWEDLCMKSVEDGVNIVMVPEPVLTSVALLGLLALAGHRRLSRWREKQDGNAASPSAPTWR